MQKLQFAVQEVKDVKESYEEYRSMTDKMLKTLTNNKNCEKDDYQRSLGNFKQLYQKEIMHIKQNHETEMK